METLAELIRQLIEQTQQEVIQAWVSILPAVAGGISSLVGARQARRAKKQEDAKMAEMAEKVQRYKSETDSKLLGWNADNETWYKGEMQRDYSQTPEALNMMRQLREEMDRQGQRSGNNNIISGATPEAAAADKDGRNRAMSNMMGNIGALAETYRDRATSRYMNAQSNLRGMELSTDQNLRGMEMGMDQKQFDRIGERRDSAGNLFYNGLTGLAGADWATILGNK